MLTPNFTAGYDSYLTALVLILLATKLEAAGSYVEAPIPTPTLLDTVGPPPGTMPRSSALISSDEDYFTPDEGGILVNGDLQSTKSRGSDSSSGGVPVLGKLTLQENVNASDTGSAKGKSARKSRKAKIEEKTNRFAHKGMFDILSDLPADGPTEVVEPPAPTSHHVMMPPFDSHFWEVYGNKLRVNGTMEGVCDLLGKAEG